MIEYKTVYIPGEMFILLSKFGDPEQPMIDAIYECIHLYHDINHQ